jgi:putative ABC transport system substrate-binding protein
MASMFRRIRYAVTITLLVVIAFGTSYSVGEASDIHIAVLISNKGAQFEKVLTGFKDYLNRKQVQAEFFVYQLDGDSHKAERALEEIKELKLSMIFSLGSFATDRAVKGIDETPIIAGLILRPDIIDKSSTATGSYLEFPIETQFKWLKRFLPKAKNIGVIYNPAENEQRVKAAEKLAREIGLELKAYAINTPEGLPFALDNIAKKTDVIWGLADSLVLTPQTARHVLLFSFRNRLPFIGLSSAWVKAGALYSLDWDYNDVSKQCGEMAIKLLQGQKVSTIQPAYPRKVLYSLNLKTAERMNVELSEELLKGAQNAY